MYNNVSQICLKCDFHLMSFEFGYTICCASTFHCTDWLEQSFSALSVLCGV